MVGRTKNLKKQRADKLRSSNGSNGNLTEDLDDIEEYGTEENQKESGGASLRR